MANAQTQPNTIQVHWIDLLSFLVIGLAYVFLKEYYSQYEAGKDVIDSTFIKKYVLDQYHIISNAAEGPANEKLGFGYVSNEDICTNGNFTSQI